MCAPSRPTNTRSVGETNEPRVLERSNASAISSHIGTVRPDPDFGVPVTPIVRDSTTRRSLGLKVDRAPRSAIASPGRSPAIAIIMIMASVLRSLAPLRRRPALAGPGESARRNCFESAAKLGLREVLVATQRVVGSFPSGPIRGKTQRRIRARPPLSRGVGKEPSESLRVRRSHLSRCRPLKHLAVAHRLEILGEPTSQFVGPKCVDVAIRSQLAHKAVRVGRHVLRVRMLPGIVLAVRVVDLASGQPSVDCLMQPHPRRRPRAAWPPLLLSASTCRSTSGTSCQAWSILSTPSGGRPRRSTHPPTTLALGLRQLAPRRSEPASTERRLRVSCVPPEACVDHRTAALVLDPKSDFGTGARRHRGRSYTASATIPQIIPQRNLIEPRETPLIHGGWADSY